MGKVIQLPRRRKLKIDLKTNSIIVGDCLEWLKEIPSNSIDMCYIDPPFFSNKNYEVIWGNGYELRSFGDRWKGGVKSYIVWMEERVKEIHRVLKPSGSVLLHCDYHASHRLRVMLDDVFGEKNFINELIWSYNSGGNTKKRFGRKHDTIFWYSKTKKYIFNFEDVSEERGRQKRNNMKKIIENGHVFYTITSNGKTYKYSEKQKMCPNDVLNISHLQQKDPERIGYKTQKPEALLDKLIKAFSNKNDIVLDCFGGGGTTASVAAQLNRNFITGDVSPVAVRVMSKRLKSLDAPPPIFRVECSTD